MAYLSSWQVSPLHPCISLWPRVYFRSIGLRLYLSPALASF